MSNVKNISGIRFGRLVAVSFSHTDKRQKAHWLCKCDCGGQGIFRSNNLQSGITTSCGCAKREILSRPRTHGRTVGARNSRKALGVYSVWAAAKSRCFNPNNDGYKAYGVLGIRMCDRWKDSFSNFLADMGERPEGLTLERDNPFGDYEPDNCRWANAKTQNSNKRGQVAIAVLEDLKKHGYGELIDLAFRRRYADAPKWLPKTLLDEPVATQAAML